MSWLFASVIRIIILLTRKLQKFLFYLDSRLDCGFDYRRHQYWVKRSARAHNMLKDVDEQYYAAQYWAVIKKNLDELRCNPAGKYLDLGCGQGRLTIPLAQWCSNAGGIVSGIDFSDSAINQAKRYALQAGQNNIEFHIADAGPYIRSLDKNSSDGIFVLEMLYFHADFQDILKQCVRVLKPDAVLIVSLRSQYFYALDLVKEGTLEGIPMLLEKRSGRLFAGDVWFNWNTSKEIESLFTRDLGLKVIDLFGIGCCSGISGDPHASVALPSHLSQPDRDVLMQLETAVGYSLPDSGRYIMVVSRKIPAC